MKILRAFRVLVVNNFFSTKALYPQMMEQSSYMKVFTRNHENCYMKIY